MGIAIPQVIAEDRASGAQVIDGSIVFERSKLKHLKKTISTTGNQKTFTVSFWFKKQLVGNVYQYFFTTEYLGSGSYFEITSNSDQFHVYGGSGVIDVKITRKLRDADGWMHAVVAIDSTIATPASDRVKIYLNGERQEDYVTGSSDFPPQNHLFTLEGSRDWYIGTAEFNGTLSSSYYDGRMSNFYFVDGQALGPEEFGFTDPLTNTWRPKKLNITTESLQPITAAPTLSNGALIIKAKGNSIGGLGESSSGSMDYHTSSDGIAWTRQSGGISHVIPAAKYLAIGGDGTNNRTFTPSGTPNEGYEYALWNTNTNFDTNSNPSDTDVTSLTYTDRPGLGVFGTNGFWLPMDGNSPIGEDKSDNENNWTPVNFSGSNTIEKATGALPILNTTNGGRVATVGVRTDAFASNLVLALPLVDTTTDASGIINSGTTSKTITAYQNAAPASDGQGVFYGVSLYLDGADDYVETSNSDDFVVGTGDFTIEAWYNVATSQGANPRLFAQNVNNDNNWDCYINGNPATGTGAIKMHGGSVDLGMSFPSANAWHHFCIARKNGTLYSFMNGVLRHTQTYTNSVGVNNHGFRVGVIGGSGGSTGYGLQGYVQDFRFYKGVAKYTSDFIPASTNPDILPDTPSGVSGSSKLAKITEGAVAFDGTDDYLTIPWSSDFDLGGGNDDWTIEFFVNFQDDATTSTILSWGSDIDNRFDIGCQSANTLRAFARSSGNTIINAPTITISPKKWHHFALVGHSDVDGNGTSAVVLYIDGVRKTANIGALDTYPMPTDTSNGIEIGRRRYGTSVSDYFGGYISNLRIVKGTAIYPYVDYDAQVTIPTEPLTNVTNTTLLCCQSTTKSTESAVAPSTSWIPTGYNYWDYGMNTNGVNWNSTGTNTSSASSTGNGDYLAAALPSSGKYYFETIVNNPSQYRVVGLGLTASGAGAGYYNDLFGWYWNGTGTPPLFLTTNASGVTKAATGVAHGDTSELTFYDGDILMWAWDADNDKIYFGRNGTWYNNGDPAAGTGNIIGGQDLSADDYYLKVGYMNAGGNALNALTLTNVPSSDSGSSTLIDPNRTIVNYNLVDKATNFNPFNTNIDIVRGQETSYATLNPLAAQKNGTITLSDGNLRATVGATRTSAYASLPFVGKMYYEVTFTIDRAYVFGMAPSIDFNTTANTAPNRFIGESSGSYGVGNDGTVYHGGANQLPGGARIETFGLNDCMGWAYDSDSGKYSIFKNGRHLGTFTASTSRTYYPAISLINNTATAVVNFGQKPFKFPPPDGYGPVNAANIRSETVIARPDQYVGVTTYHGDNIVRTQKVGFKPDLVWIKDYSSNSHFHVLCDSVRGGANILSSSNDLKQFNNTGYVQGFESDGFRLGADTHVNGDPGTPYTYVAWAWKAGGEVGVGRSFMIDGVGFSTAGDAGFNPQAIPTGGSPNAVEIEPFKASISTKTGFSIVHYKGSDNDNDGILHGLTQKPDLVIVKNMNRIQTTGNENYTEWRVWHSGFGDNRNLKLGADGAQDKNYWADGSIYGHTSPDTSMRMVGSSTKFGVNYLNDDYIMYSWHNVPGLQKFGTFIGINDADGPFIELGFRPAIIWVKRFTSSGSGAYNWIVQDSERQKYNPVSDYLVLNQINQTATGLDVDFLSNGFKLRNANGNMNTNTANDQYIYCAWAESPSVNLYGGQSNTR